MVHAHAWPEPVPVAEAAKRRVVIVAWRDLASPKAGGSELLVDQLATGMVQRGHDVTLLCGGVTGERPYRVVRSGGDYSQFLLAPLAFRQRIEECDVVVEVCNGLPYLAPLWCGRPVVCLVNHVHTRLWRLRYPPPVSTLGRFAERVVMPKVHTGSVFLTVSRSSALDLAAIGVRPDRIRVLHNGVDTPVRREPRSAEPMFLALGRLADYKRLDLLLSLWERVRPVTGGQLVIAGDGPDRARLERLAGASVTFTGRVSEAEKNRLLCGAWLLVHPAVMEGWGIVVMEAAARGTPTVGFDVPGLRDSVLHGRTGLLATSESGFASAWAGLALNRARRARMGERAVAYAARQHWSAAVDRFAEVVEEAVTHEPRLASVVN